MSFQLLESILILLLLDNNQPTIKGDVSNEELYQLSQELHVADINAVPGIVLNFQGHTYSGNQIDNAALPLFSKVPNEVWSQPTIATLMALYDNYVADVSTNEEVTSQELAEEEAFLNAIFATNVTKKAHAFLASKGLTDADIDVYKTHFRSLWFGLYSRSSRIVGSSGFEHIFLGELKNGISGLHSWYRYYKEELTGKMNYLGFIRKVDLGTHKVMEMPILWNGVYKPISSISIGGSPELELALATVCFMTRPNAKCPVKGANGRTYHFVTHAQTYHGKTYVGSAYPSL